MPAASSAPGAGLRKPTRVRRSNGRTAGERSVSRTYKSLPRPKRSKAKYVPYPKASRQYWKRVYGDAKEHSTRLFVPSYELEKAMLDSRKSSDMRRDSKRLLEQELANLISRVEETSPNFAKKIKEADANVLWWKPLTRSNKNRTGEYLPPYRKNGNTIKVSPQLTENFASGVPGSKNMIRKLLLHEMAHSTQAHPRPPKISGNLTKKEWQDVLSAYSAQRRWVEPQAEIKARKAMRRAYGRDLLKGYPEEVRMFRRLKIGR